MELPPSLGGLLHFIEIKDDSLVIVRITGGSGTAKSKNKTNHG